MACNLQLARVGLSNGLPRYELTVFNNGRVCGIFVAITAEDLAERCEAARCMLNVATIAIYVDHVCWQLATNPRFPNSRFTFLTYSGLPRPISSCHVDVDYVWGETGNSDDVRELRAATVCNFPDISVVTCRLYETTLRGLYQSASSFADLLRSSDTERVVLDGDLTLVTSIELNDNDANCAERAFVRHAGISTRVITPHRDLAESRGRGSTAVWFDEVAYDVQPARVGVDRAAVAAEIAEHVEQPAEDGEAAFTVAATPDDVPAVFAAMSTSELGQPYPQSWGASPLATQWEMWRERRAQEIMEQAWVRYADSYSFGAMQWATPVMRVPEELPEKLPKPTRKRRHALLSPTKLEDE